MRIWPAVAVALLATPAAPALAQSDPQSGTPLPAREPARAPAREPAREPEISSPIHDHFYAYAAFYSPVVHTDMRVDPRNAPPGVTGTPVSAERDLGLPGRLNQGRVEFMFRLRERNKLRVDYFEANRSGTRLLTNNLVFGDVTFAAGETLLSSIDWRVFGLTYTYSLYRSERLEIGTGLGVYALQAEARGVVPSTGQNQDVSAAEPIPTIPLDFTWCISRRFAFTARANYLRAAISGSSGSLSDLHGDLQYRWNPYFSLGLGYTSMRTSIHLRSGSFPGEVSQHFDGAEGFVRVSF
jgi:hypothetical protein